MKLDVGCKVVYPEDWKYIHVEAEDDEMYPLPPS